MRESATRFVQVALPLPLFQTFTYAVEGGLANPITVGSRVVVPLRNDKEVGICVGLTDISPHNPRRVIDDESLHALANFVARLGVLQPILVRSSPEQGRYEIYTIADAETRTLGGRLSRPSCSDRNRVALTRLSWILTFAWDVQRWEMLSPAK